MAKFQVFVLVAAMAISANAGVLSGAHSVQSVQLASSQLIQPQLSVVQAPQVSQIRLVQAPQQVSQIRLVQAPQQISQVQLVQAQPSAVRLVAQAPATQVLQAPAGPANIVSGLRISPPVGPLVLSTPAQVPQLQQQVLVKQVPAQVQTIQQVQPLQQVQYQQVQSVQQVQPLQLQPVQQVQYQQIQPAQQVQLQQVQPLQVQQVHSVPVQQVQVQQVAPQYNVVKQVQAVSGGY